MEEDNRSLLTRAQDLVGEAEDLAYELSKSAREHHDEVGRLTLALAQTANEVEQYREANLKLLRERDSARSGRDAHAQSIHLLSEEVRALTLSRDTWRHTAEGVDRHWTGVQGKLQSDLTAQEQENGRLSAEIERLKNQPASNGRTESARSEGAWVIKYDVTQEYWTGSHSDTAKNGAACWSSDINRAQRWGTHPDWWSGAGQAVFIPGLSVERGAK